MNTDISIEEFILNYCREVGGLVEPPAFGSHEVLLPDEVAERWKMPAFQHLAFTPGVPNAAYIHFGHPLVETIVTEVREKIANGRFFINHVRPEKPKLFEVIEKAISLTNARLFPIPEAAEKIALHHYVRFNFKVSLIADEKREVILPVWMDLQSGVAVNGNEIERTAFFDFENQNPILPLAPLRWDSAAPLSDLAFNALLERARLSTAHELGDTLTTLQKRLQRLLELDRARLNDYYDELSKDTRRRLTKADEDRRPGLEAKLSTIASERQIKLADVEQKYHLHIQLELINLAVIAQPKLDLWVEIRRRGTSLKRQVTWDPLLHVVEGLACDVCLRSSCALVLCENDHLVHEECLAPQCIDCKRIFCKECASEVQSCSVCHRPVCIHSLNRCKECGQTTCLEHIAACHAPAEKALPNLPIPTSSSQASSGSETGHPVKPAEKGTAQKTPPRREALKSLLVSGKPLAKDRPEVSGESLNVYSDPLENNIVAFVKARKREVASRQWAMTAEGIAVTCWCGKPDCDKRGVIYRPFALDHLADQMLDLVEEFANEYAVPPKKINFFHIREGKPFSENKLRLPTGWRDPDTLERAWAGFEELRQRNRSRL
jgi:hypothetical protein